MSESKKVWSNFSARTGDLKLCILDTPEDRIDEAMELYIKYYVAEETICKSIGIKDNPEALKEYEAIGSEGLFKNNSQVNIMTCCIVNEDGTLGDIVGVNFSYLTTADKPLELNMDPQTKEVQTMLKVAADMMSLYNIIHEHGVSKCYEGLGIIVHPNYRRLGIAQEFLKARRLMCKDQGISITGAWMTSIGTQKAAAREGYETVYELNFEEFGKKHGVSFKDTPEFCKFMIAKQ